MPISLDSFSYELAITTSTVCYDKTVVTTISQKLHNISTVNIRLTEPIPNDNSIRFERLNHFLYLFH